MKSSVMARQDRPSSGMGGVPVGKNTSAQAGTATRPGGTRLNFVVVGECRSGMSAVADIINNHGHAVCHAGLFADDAQARKQAHESYFGRSASRKYSWFCAGDKEVEGSKFSHPYEYIEEVLAGARYGEQAVGLCLPYQVVARHELYELLSDLTGRGDFCLVHVVRNPLTCLVSREQAAASGRWISYVNEPDERYSPLPVAVDPKAAAEFIERSCVVRNKVAAAADDAVELHYDDLVGRFDRVAARLFQFLELADRRPVCRTRRLVGLPLRCRLLNSGCLGEKLPHSMRHWLRDQ